MRIIIPLTCDTESEQLTIGVHPMAEEISPRIIFISKLLSLKSNLNIFILVYTQEYWD